MTCIYYFCFESTFFFLNFLSANDYYVSLFQCCENSELHEKISNLEQQLNSVMGEKLSCEPCTSEEIDFLKTKILSQVITVILSI